MCHRCPCSIAILDLLLAWLPLPQSLQLLARIHGLLLPAIGRLS